MGDRDWGRVKRHRRSTSEKLANAEKKLQEQQRYEAHKAEYRANYRYDYKPETR